MTIIGTGDRAGRAAPHPPQLGRSPFLSGIFSVNNSFTVNKNGPIQLEIYDCLVSKKMAIAMQSDFNRSSSLFANL